MVVDTKHLKRFYLPGEDRLHYAVFLAGAGARRLTRWTIDRESADKTAAQMDVAVKVRAELMAWAISDLEWPATDDAAMFRQWEAWQASRNAEMVTKVT
jgi:hypothetical protein